MDKVQNIQRYQFDKNRAEMARQQWILNRCQDIPLPYQMLIPPSFYAAELLEAETLARTMFERDAKEYAENPWRIVAETRLDLVDWTGVSGLDRFPGIGLRYEVWRKDRVIRKGFENHPDVLASIANSKKPIEAIRDFVVFNWEGRVAAATKAMHDAKDAGATGDELAALQVKVCEASDSCDRVKSITLEEWRDIDPALLAIVP